MSFRRACRHLLTVLLLLGAFIFVNNTNLFARRPPGRPLLLAHRGIAQRFPMNDIQSDTCTASRIFPPTHPFLENTIASMRAAFAIGADVVEFDLQPTTDGQFAVFHDWSVDCRTDGKGVTRTYSMAALRALDIGHGYTPDGAAFPFRGKGVGLMPTLDEVLETFPDRDFLVHVKSNDPHEGERLAARLAQLPLERRRHLMVYGASTPINVVRAALPDVRTLSGASVKACLLRYVASGWTGVVPAACRDTLLVIPSDYAPWLWGWPNRFLNRMDAVGTRVFLQGERHGNWSTGVDTAEQFARLPAGYSGGIWTDRIEVIAPIAKPSRKDTFP